MTNERMLELTLLMKILDGVGDNFVIQDGVKCTKATDGNMYNITKMATRANALIDEFLEPYVISKPSKED